MKKIITILLVLAFLLHVSGCTFHEDVVANSLGKISKEEFFTDGGFQDRTDYAKYSYKDVDFTNNSYFKQITEADEEKLRARIAVFEQWVALTKEGDPGNELVVHYDFDVSMISKNDYLYIDDSYEDPNDPMLSSFNVYFFDVETMTLYYFHHNI